jgi:hypothetical protein
MKILIMMMAEVPMKILIIMMMAEVPMKILIMMMAEVPMRMVKNPDPCDNKHNTSSP